VIADLTLFSGARPIVEARVEAAGGDVLIVDPLGMAVLAFLFSTVPILETRIEAAGGDGLIVGPLGMALLSPLFIAVPILETRIGAAQRRGVSLATAPVLIADLTLFSGARPVVETWIS
jgi:hypothetical protein